ncbi:MAG: hypothetical protein LBP89_05445 [Helicobacteraceae bacterium]|jgi:hypothetical protein|nr:hypothetical protein [Helicobacteraceae bacterium]
MRFFVPLILGAFLIAFLSPRPVFIKPDGRSLMMQPYLLRAISGYARTIAGNYVWLKSYYVDETRYGDAVDIEVLVAVFRSQIILDPHFTKPVLYAATYLASIPKKPLLSLELLELSQSLNPDRFDLLINEALIRMNYNVPDSYDRLVELARRIEPLPEKTKLVGSMLMDDLIHDAIAYTSTQEGKQKMIEADLIELLKQTENPERKARIQAELDRVRAQKNEN